MLMMNKIDKNRTEIDLLGQNKVEDVETGRRRAAPLNFACLHITRARYIFMFEWKKRRLFDCYLFAPFIPHPFCAGIVRPFEVASYHIPVVIVFYFKSIFCICSHKVANVAFVIFLWNYYQTKEMN